MSAPRRAPLFVTSVIAIIVAFVFILRTSAQENLPYDTQAVFRTHVPHLASGHGGGGGGGKPGSGGGGTVTFGGAGYTTVGATVTPTSTGPEAEEHIAADPGNVNNLVSAISDFSLRGGSNTTKYAYSTNGGAAWSQSFVPLDGSNNPVTSDGISWPYNSDPVVAIDTQGRVFLANLYFHSESNNGSNGLYVSVGQTASPGLGVTAASTYPVAVQTNPSTTIDEDKEWIAADTSASAFRDNVYVSWTRFNGNSDQIVFSRSTNHGVTWSAPIAISPSAQNGAVQGSGVAVGPNGEVYVAYEVFYIGNRRAQFLAKSTNGGVSFSTAAAITPQFNELSFNSTYRKNTFAAIAVGPTGAVYVVYADQGGKNARIDFIKSTNGGASFSSPLALNDSATGQRLMPAISAGPTNEIHVSWFDTRLGVVNTSTSYDIYATRSADGGATFSNNARVTSSTIDAGTASFIGDYGGIAFNGSAAFPVWTNGGFNGGKLQVARLQN